MPNESVLMANEVIGRIIDFPNKPPIRLYDCPQCPIYRAHIKDLKGAIRDYLRDYAVRSINQESTALQKLRSAIGE